MIAANLARAGLIGAVPIAAALGVLSIPFLAVVAFAAGCGAVLFEVAFLAYVPSLVGRDRLTAANTRLFSSASAADVVGPGLAGTLVSLVGAPFALAADALSYLVSAASLIAIGEAPTCLVNKRCRWREPMPMRSASSSTEISSSTPSWMSRSARRTTAEVPSQPGVPGAASGRQRRHGLKPASAAPAAVA